MVMIGTDSHRRTHTVVALDDVGRRLDELTVAATSAGHLRLLEWTTQFDGVQFALEDCRVGARYCAHGRTCRFVIGGCPA
jgi:transposase